MFSEQVCRAFKPNKLSKQLVVDLTAGLGRDSFLLATSGFDILMIERNEILYALLDDALSRLRKVDPLVGNRMSVVNCDSTTLNDIRDISFLLPDKNFSDYSSIGVYLDPMYESGLVGRKSKVKKDTSMLHKLIEPLDPSESDRNNQLLLESAYRLSNSRIVVKRPLKSTHLVHAAPQSQIVGSTHRFDIYFKDHCMMELRCKVE